MTRTRNAAGWLSTAGCAAAVAAGAGGQAQGAIAPYLGAAGQYAVLGVNSTTMTFGGPSLWVSSNAGVGPSSSLNFSGGFILGRIDQHPGATVSLSGGNPPLGGLLSTSLSQAYSDAAAAAALASSNIPTSTLTSILGTQTITGASGVNAISVSGSINLGSGTTLTLSGPSDAYFVLNVFGGMTVSGAQIILAGGATADRVMFNLATGGSGAVSISGGSTVNGTVLAMNRNMTLSASTLRGQFIGAESRTLDLNSSPTVTYIAFSSPPIPAPQTAALLGGLLLLGSRARRRVQV